MPCRRRNCLKLGSNIDDSNDIGLLCYGKQCLEVIFPLKFGLFRTISFVTGPPAMSLPGKLNALVELPPRQPN